VVRVRAGAEAESFPSACFYDNRKFMKKSINDNRKRNRGRPATGTAPLVGVRMTEQLQAQIKAWAKKQDDDPPLATAVRRLVELGLTAKTRSVPSERQRAALADLAAKAAGAAPDNDETASRKRRLLKGPEEFRDDRVDLPKAKAKK
jgi:hypothetical protein